MSNSMGEIKLLFVAPFGEYGGSEMVLMRLLEALDDSFDPRVMLLGGGRFVEMLQEEGVPTAVDDLPGKRGVLGFPRAIRAAAKRYRDADISLIHANGTKAAMFAIPLARQLGVPLLWMKHDHFYDGFVARRLAARCDRVVCVSEAMAAQFPRRVRDRTTIAYPGVWLSPPVELSQTEPLIACVGRLDPAKGFYDLIRATAILRERGVDARIRVAGPVDRIYRNHEAELKQLVIDLGLEQYAEVGWVDDLEALYRRCRVFAMASRPEVPGKPSEGAPTVLMEAMAQSRPVVAPREPGMAEVMGDVGTLVDEVNPEGLADALEPYLRDEALAAAVGREGRARTEQLFSMERTVATLEGLYRQLAGVTTTPPQLTR
jgi:glycosyltransferase involved in cell wall biosynthesis